MASQPSLCMCRSMPHCLQISEENSLAVSVDEVCKEGGCAFSVTLLETNFKGIE